MIVEKKILAIICLFLPWLTACSAALKKGDIEHANVYAPEIKLRIDSGTLTSSAERASIDINALSGEWEVKSLAITSDQYNDLIRKSYVNLRIPSDSLSIHCENILQTAVAFTTYVPNLKARVTDKYKLSLRDAECLSIRRETIHAVIGLYNFGELISTQVPDSERIQRLEEALKWYSEGLSFKQSDMSIWSYSDMLVGEAVGNIFHHVRGPIPSTTLFEKKDQNYYRVVLISNWTIVAMDVMYPLSMPLDKLQENVFPLIKTLRYTNK